MGEWTVLSPYAFAGFHPTEAIAMRLVLGSLGGHGRLGKLLARDLPIGALPHFPGVLLIDMDLEVAHESLLRRSGPSEIDVLPIELKWIFKL